ncbi:uncharacterized protein EV422DRAFT_117548 [Fimicolochytrium jonesii]|uniref:uncharacterized protein n=1 Tax=Fimicolochytrium jonesii TaxID=1396493 RepID=UPI0022FDEBD6|nr:uncharacterized protein EV422DRAFT_117548 [Fimicolochytrium jonesii]KAI8819110.1 hypothetical protein EV422DRAFT_117548 [Fimicolochytrium jonesii]
MHWGALHRLGAGVQHKALLFVRLIRACRHAHPPPHNRLLPENDGSWIRHPHDHHREPPLFLFRPAAGIGRGIGIGIGRGIGVGRGGGTVGAAWRRRSTTNALSSTTASSTTASSTAGSSTTTTASSSRCSLGSNHLDRRGGRVRTNQKLNQMC